jgi:hypothetical protein
MPSVSSRAVIHLGLDVHKDSISVGILEPDRETTEVDGSSRRVLRPPPDRPLSRAAQLSGQLRGRGHRLRPAPPQHPRSVLRRRSALAHPEGAW